MTIVIQICRKSKVVADAEKEEFQGLVLDLNAPSSSTQVDGMNHEKTAELDRPASRHDSSKTQPEVPEAPGVFKLCYLETSLFLLIWLPFHIRYFFLYMLRYMINK